MARKPRFSAFQTHTSPFHLSVFHFLTDTFSFQKDLRQLVETQTAKKNKTNQENQNQETLRQSSKMFPATGGCSVPKTADCSGLLIMLFRPSQPLMIFVCLFYQGFPVALVIENLPAMQETQVQSLGQEDPLEQEMATDSRNLAWRIPWTEEPGHGATKRQTQVSACTHVPSPSY